MDCNPLSFDTDQIDMSETVFQILEEVRSMKEKLEKSDVEKKKLLQDLKEEVKNLRGEIREMKMYADPEFKLLPNMPFESITDLRGFDEKLPQDDALRTELHAFLKRFATKDYPSFLRAALRAIVTDELAVNLTWRGTPEKPSIQTFTVFVILRDLCHIRFSNSSHAEINRICQQHFLHAKDRICKKLKPINYISHSTNPIKRDHSPTLLSSSSSSSSPSPQPSHQHSPLLPPMPITTLSTLEEFDEKLLSDTKTKFALKKFVNNINGRDYSVFVRSAFRAIITDNVAMEMTWRGTKEKPSIQDFKIFSIIKEAGQKKFSELSIADFNRVCQQHFLHAKDRVSKRIKLF